MFYFQTIPSIDLFYILDAFFQRRFQIKHKRNTRFESIREAKQSSVLISCTSTIPDATLARSSAQMQFRCTKCIIYFFPLKQRCKRAPSPFEVTFIYSRPSSFQIRTPVRHYEKSSRPLWFIIIREDEWTECNNLRRVTGEKNLGIQVNSRRGTQWMNRSKPYYV